MNQTSNKNIKKKYKYNNKRNRYNRYNDKKIKNI